MAGPHAFNSCLSQINSPRTVNMKYSALSFLLFSVAVFGVSAEKIHKENDNSTTIANKTVDDGMKNDLETFPSKTPMTGKANSQRKKPQALVTPDRKIVMHSTHESNSRLKKPKQGRSQLQIPNLGFSNAENENQQHFFLSGDTGSYDVELRSFQRPDTQHLNTAIGAISARILSQRTNQEYIPYPPNGDPYNYPAYRGYGHATEPPVVRAYEEASNPNYGGQPPANFVQYNPRRIFVNNGYQQGFPNQFDNLGLAFYTNPNTFNENGYYPRETAEPAYQDRFL